MKRCCCLVLLPLLLVCLPSRPEAAGDKPAFRTQEIATDLRAITGISAAKGMTETEVTIDGPRRTVTMRGTAGQIALGAWLIDALDKPGPNPGTREYRLPESESARPAWLPGGRDDVVRVFYVTHAETPREIQELAT